MPSFSIIVPTYKRPDFLTRFLNSLKDSGFLGRDDVEIIIVENHDSLQSFEQTKEICSRYDHAPIKVLHEKYAGKSFALNTGIKFSKGEFIFFTDDDVVIQDSNLLEKLSNCYDKSQNVGYVSGKVCMNPDGANEWSRLWEAKGGLSKGDRPKLWDQNYLHQMYYKFFPWPFYKICAGANSMIPRAVLNDIGYFSTDLVGNSHIDGLTLEIGYRVATHGYMLAYEPSAMLLHSHPVTREEIYKKLYFYGRQDTAYSMHIAVTYHDYRYFWWAIIGHPLYTLKKCILSLLGYYPLPLKMVLSGLAGNLSGWPIYLFHRIVEKNGPAS